MPASLVACVGAVVMLITQCNSGGSAPAAESTGPALVITEPANGATLDRAHLEVPVAFFAEGFTVQDPEQPCSGKERCGQVVLYVDGVTCNAPGQAYNNLGAGSPISARLDRCLRLPGNHQIKLELVYDDGTPVMDAAGVAITASVDVTVPGDVTP